MTTLLPKRIIELATEGGYGKSKEPYSTFTSGMLLDPSFWQCLGKRLGWREKYKHFIDEKRPALRCLDCDRKPMVGDGVCYRNLENMSLTKAHEFLDALHENKTKEFWESITPKE